MELPIETWETLALETTTFKIGTPPIGPSIYFLLYQGKCVYVGQSIEPFARIGSHMEDKVFDGAEIYPCDRRHLDRLESFFAYILLPELNGGVDKPIKVPISLGKWRETERNTGWAIPSPLWRRYRKQLMAMSYYAAEHGISSIKKGVSIYDWNEEYMDGGGI